LVELLCELLEGWSDAQLFGVLFEFRDGDPKSVCDGRDLAFGERY
jgi:hypothetical protein